MTTSLSLPAAIRAAQASETVLSEMNLPRWALTFDCSVEDVMKEWQRQEWERTRKPQNSCEVFDGK